MQNVSRACVLNTHACGNATLRAWYGGVKWRTRCDIIVRRKRDVGGFV